MTVGKGQRLRNIDPESHEHTNRTRKGCRGERVQIGVLGFDVAGMSESKGDGVCV